MTDTWITACSYKISKTSDWIPGIAIGREIGVSDIKIIIDIETLEKAKSVYDYRLKSHFGAFAITEETFR